MGDRYIIVEYHFQKRVEYDELISDKDITDFGLEYAKKHGLQYVGAEDRMGHR